MRDSNSAARGHLGVPGALPAALCVALVCSVVVATGALASERRLPDGTPDINGIWQALNTANYNLEPQPAKAALAMREGPAGPIPAGEVVALGTVASVPGGLGVVVGGKIPYTDAARAQRDENRERYLTSDPEIKCYMPGIPRANYQPFPFQIIHSDKSMMFVYEFAGAVRNVFFDDPGPAVIDSWMGQSVGRWDGDTLEIKVTGLNGQSWYDRAGNYQSPTTVITERFTPQGENHLLYEATIEDPALYTEPWTIRMPLYRRVEENAMLMQFKCVEFVEELIYGHLRKHPVD